MRAHLCNLLDTYLPRVITRQVKEALRERNDIEGRTRMSVVNLLLREIRSGGVEEKEEDEEEEAKAEEGKKRLYQAKEIYYEPTVQAIGSVHKTYADPIVQHARKRGRRGKPAKKHRRE